ncbi:MAG: DNA repair protein RecO [Chloroflexota bacterium]|nr:DNA repair protein RecO [Anaerolineaceae bacterium]MEE3229214.1 DNA repair protein RecO [Chloroflexota bacterium]
MARTRTIRTETIVLRHQVFGEADRLLTLLTPNHGKVRAIAKGVRRPSSRKTGHLDLYMRSDVLLASGRNLYVVTQAQTIDAYRQLRENLVRSSYASCSIELLDSFTPDGEPNIDLYYLLEQMLSSISVSDNLSIIMRHYELHLLEMVGFRPELEFCVGDNKPIQPENQFFDALAGGVLCPQCGSGKPNVMPVSMDTLRLMRFLQRNNYSSINNLSVRSKVAAEIEKIQLHYISIQLERQLKSVDFLDRVRRLDINSFDKIISPTQAVNRFEQ